MKPKATNGKLLTPQQIRETYGVAVAKLYKWCREGRLKHVRPDRSILIPENDFLAFVERYSVEVRD
ncbi:MAG TPA: helix-turn-helix domain-containing protein [Thermodesulfobacteriota bacterium]|nr:helix-turn-helix domain-containing protein [Thermodesulfobacteriota bacterium]